MPGPRIRSTVAAAAAAAGPAARPVAGPAAGPVAGPVARPVARLSLSSRPVDDKDIELMGACKAGNHKVVIQLLRNGANTDVRERPSLGTPLHIAAQEGKIQVVTELLSFKADNPKERYADPNSEDKRGRTPIFLAALKGQLAVVKLLLQHGATVNQDENRRTPLFMAAFGGHLEVVQALLDAGANANQVDHIGETHFIKRLKRDMEVLLNSF